MLILTFKCSSTQAWQERHHHTQVKFLGKHMNEENSIWKKTYENIDDWETSNCPISSQVCISKKGSNQWCDVAGPWPIGDIVGGCDISLIETQLQIIHQVGAHTIVCQPLTTFISYEKIIQCPTSQSQIA